MRRLWCRVIGHDIQQRYSYKVGGIYPRTLVWCQCCGVWFEDRGNIRERPAWLR